jgi:hypothetical protein
MTPSKRAIAVVNELQSKTGVKFNPKFNVAARIVLAALTAPYEKLNEWQLERVANHMRLFTIQVVTRVPSKYRLVDLETGNVWGITDKGRWTAKEDLIFQVKP